MFKQLFFSRSSKDYFFNLLSIFVLLCRHFKKNWHYRERNIRVK